MGSQNPSVTLLPQNPKPPQPVSSPPKPPQPASSQLGSSIVKKKPTVNHRNAETKAPRHDCSHLQLCFSQQRNRAKHRRSGVEATKAVLCLLRHNNHNNINTDGLLPCSLNSNNKCSRPHALFQKAKEGNLGRGNSYRSHTIEEERC